MDLAWPLARLPTIAIAGRFALADRHHGTTYRGATHALHLHDYSGEMRLAGATLPLSPGDLTISPAELPSSYHLVRPGHHWCIHLTLPEGDDACVAIALIHRGCDALRERFAHIASLVAVPDDPVAVAGARVAAAELMLTLARRASPVADSAPDRAAAFIDAHFAEPIDVAAIAAATGRSPAYLARRFRQRFGTTMPHRLLARRAAHARYLLESTDLPIWRVAERVGIPDSQHFNKTVRRLLGASPSAIRAAATGPKVDPDR